MILDKEETKKQGVSVYTMAKPKVEPKVEKKQKKIEEKFEEPVEDSISFRDEEE
jgi:hypothetical protein